MPFPYSAAFSTRFDPSSEIVSSNPFPAKMPAEYDAPLSYTTALVTTALESESVPFVAVPSNHAVPSPRMLVALALVTCTPPTQRG